MYVVNTWIVFKIFEYTNHAGKAALQEYEFYRDLLFCLQPLPHISEEWHQPLPDTSPCKDPRQSQAPTHSLIYPACTDSEKSLYVYSLH